MQIETAAQLWTKQQLTEVKQAIKGASAILVQGSIAAGRKLLMEYLLTSLVSETKLLASNNHPDVKILTADKIKIADVRWVIDFLHTKPAIANYKVVMLLNADSLNFSSANALLKTLEEPLSGAKIILGSSIKLLPTIMSRCQIVGVPHADKFYADTDLAWLDLEPLAELEQSKELLMQIIQVNNLLDWQNLAKAADSKSIAYLLQVLLLDMLKYKMGCGALASSQLDPSWQVKVEQINVSRLFAALDFLLIIKSKLATKISLHEAALTYQLFDIWAGVIQL